MAITPGVNVMQTLRIRALHTAFLAVREVRARMISSAVILLAVTGACSNAAPAAQQATGSNESLASDATESKLVVGYLPSWRGALSEWTQTLDFSALTHVNLAFATLETQNDELAIHYRQDGGAGDEPGLAAFVAKAHANGVKVCLAVGGGGERSITSGNAILRAPKELAEKVALYVQDHELDCIDADQEELYPTAELDAAYGEFIGELGRRLHGMRKQLSAAVASWNAEKVLPVIGEFDFLNVMAYDFNRPGDSLTPVQASSLADAQIELDWWVSRGAQEEKVVLGVPFYGFKWSGSAGEAITYSQIVDQFGSAPTHDQIEVGQSTITLNSSATIRSKAEFAKAKYAGLMIWEMGQDASNENALLRVVKDVMR